MPEGPLWTPFWGGVEAGPLSLLVLAGVSSQAAPGQGEGVFSGPGRWALSVTLRKQRVGLAQVTTGGCGVLARIACLGLWGAGGGWEAGSPPSLALTGTLPVPLLRPRAVSSCTEVGVGAGQGGLWGLSHVGWGLGPVVGSSPAWQSPGMWGHCEGDRHSTPQGWMLPHSVLCPWGTPNLHSTYNPASTCRMECQRRGGAHLGGRREHPQTGARSREGRHRPGLEESWAVG